MTGSTLDSRGDELGEREQVEALTAAKVAAIYAARAANPVCRWLGHDAILATNRAFWLCRRCCLSWPVG